MDGASNAEVVTGADLSPMPSASDIVPPGAPQGATRFFSFSEGFRGKWSWLPFKPAKPQKILTALKDFQSKRFSVDQRIFLLAKEDLKHMLERHHPRFWEGSLKRNQSFYPKNISVDELMDVIDQGIKHNRDKLATLVTRGGQIEVKIGDILWTIGVNRGGHIRQLFPEYLKPGGN